jgi:hypothetical protein
MRNASPHQAAEQAVGSTVADLQRRWRVGQDKILGWIRRGELRALNVATAVCARPRYVVTPDALAEFEGRRASGPPPKPRRRPRQTGLVDYYPDGPAEQEGGRRE